MLDLSMPEVDQPQYQQRGCPPHVRDAGQAAVLLVIVVVALTTMTLSGLAAAGRAPFVIERGRRPPLMPQPSLRWPVGRTVVAPAPQQDRRCQRVDAGVVGRRDPDRTR